MGTDLFHRIQKEISKLKNTRGVSGNMRVANFIRTIKDPAERAKQRENWKNS